VPLVSLFFLLVYSALDWLLVERTGWIALDKDIVDFWIPFVTAFALAQILIGPRVSMLKFGKGSDAPFFYVLIATLTIAFPAVLGQFYLHDATGTLEHVADIGRIADEPGARYYAADRVCMDRANASVQPFAQAEGRSGQNLDLALYVAVPLCERTRVWIAVAYHRTISNRLSNAEKQTQYAAFVRSSQTKFDAEGTRRYAYFERVRSGVDLREFKKAVAKKYPDEQPILLMPAQQNFYARAGNTLEATFGLLVGGSLLWAFSLFFARVDRGAEHARIAEQEKEEGRLAQRFLFIPNRGNWGLPLLLDVNILVYLAMVFAGLGVASFQAEDLIIWGGNYGPLLHDIGLVRLITNQFVHAGLMHLANNMYGLIFAAIFLLPIARNGWLVAAYLLCGLTASIASTTMHPNTVSVGASGAIFGLYGILLALAVLGDERLVDTRKAIFINAGIFVGLNLLIGAATPMIDNAAHVGGLLCGSALGLLAFLTGIPKTEA
jgi:membrane associated rhomboid family serine protease